MMNMTKPEPEWTPEATQALLDELAAPAITAASQNPSVAGKRLAAGRTTAKVKTLTNDLDVTRKEVAALERQLGDVFGDGLDVTAVQDALKNAEARVRLLELALSSAMEKDRAAQAGLKAAQHAAELSTETDALTHLKEKGVKFDNILYQLETFLVQELVPALDAARAVSGNGSQASFLKDAHLAVELYVMRACRYFMPKGRVAATMLGSRSYSDRLPNGPYAAERRSWK